MLAKGGVLPTAIVVGLTIPTINGVPLYQKLQIVLNWIQDVLIAELVVIFFTSTSTYLDMVTH